ncbi:MAG: ABC transporter ATP-binding protein [Coriobacteriia bacterium]|nr:ABC transporter ATP-binding protein [Coriobacteriia bacterium]
MVLLEFNKVSKAFFADRKKKDAFLALDALDIQIHEGEFVCLLGPSGSGKTVTLSMAAGFLSPTLGTVKYRGETIEGPGPERGVVFQEYSLMPWMSVKDNVHFALKESLPKNANLTKEEMKSRVEAALAAVGLSHAADKRPNTLSGGMKQRVAIARLLAMNSEVFLMDEPFSALDQKNREQLNETLVKLWKAENKTILFVTHNIFEAVSIATRIILFSSSPGRIIKEWNLEGNRNRDMSSAENQRLIAEINEAMPLSSAQDFA